METKDDGEQQKTYEFLKPYAEPPIGDLRWRKPRLKETKCWKGTLKYKDENVRCAQPDGFGGGSNNEDCLILSIRTSLLSKDS